MTEKGITWKEWPFTRAEASGLVEQRCQHCKREIKVLERVVYWVKDGELSVYHEICYDGPESKKIIAAFERGLGKKGK